MPTDKHTLPVRLSRAQKSVLDKLHEKIGVPSAEMARRALQTYVTSQGVPWPTTADGRRRKGPAKQPTPLPPIPELLGHEHFREFRRLVQEVVLRKAPMDRAKWGFILAHYAAAKQGGMRAQIKDWWALMHAHRIHTEEEDRLDLPPDMEKETKLRLITLFHYESLRTEWQERRQVDRYALPPKKLAALQARERAKSRQRRARARTLREGVRAAMIEDVTTGPDESPEVEITLEEKAS
jgi:hypothetical protein